MVYLPLFILAAMFVGGIVFVALRYKSRLWRWLFVVEFLFSFWSLGNCFVPGSWGQLWKTELAYLAATAAVAFASARLEMRANVREGRVGTTDVFATRQMVCLYVVVGAVGLIVVTHL